MFLLLLRHSSSNNSSPQSTLRLLLAALWVSSSLTMASSSSSSSSSSTNTPIKTVSIVGGTHGNEYTGVWIIQALERAAAKAQLQQDYPSLTISTLLGNPAAHEANRRFMDVDLNRQFTKAVLEGTDEGQLEYGRAREINQILGPKQLRPDGPPPAADVVIDCHSTTTNMGMTLIVAEGDALMARAAAYIRDKCNRQFATDDSNNTIFKCLVHGHKARSEQPFLPSVGKHGMTLEIGPVPQGVLRHDAVQKTRAAIDALLEYLELHNRELQGSSSSNSIQQQLHKAYPNGRVPCYRSAPAITPQGATGKIAWPCHPDNPNFPQWMVHEAIQDQDFVQVHEGDPLFTDLDGNVVTYNGAFGQPVHLTFINEGGYYYETSGTGIGVVLAAEYDLATGKLLLDSNDNDDGKDATTKQDEL